LWGSLSTNISHLIVTSPTYATKATSTFMLYVIYDLALTVLLSTRTRRCIVNSRLDYCNSILSKSSHYNLQMLQRVQNNLARAVCKAPRRSSASVLFKQLHWLPIRCRVDYKLACITHKALNEQSPAYIYDLLTKHRPIISKSTSGKSLLVILATATKVAEDAFRFAAPTIIIYT